MYLLSSLVRSYVCSVTHSLVNMLVLFDSSFVRSFVS